MGELSWNGVDMFRLYRWWYKSMKFFSPIPMPCLSCMYSYCFQYWYIPVMVIHSCNYPKKRLCRCEYIWAAEQVWQTQQPPDQCLLYCAWKASSCNLRGPKFQKVSMLRADNWLLGRWVPLITGLGLKHLKDFLCKANRSTLHYVLASFVLFHSIRHLKVSFTAGKAAGYLRMHRMCLLKLIKYAHDLWPLQLWGGCMNAGQYKAELAMSRLVRK